MSGNGTFNGGRVNFVRLAAALVALFFVTTGLGAAAYSPAGPAASGTPDAPAPLAGGGPDAFGYVWIDSKAPTPQITYGWIDITGSGTNAGLAGDDEYSSASLGFSFGFYGSVYTTVFFSTNGLLSLGSGTSDWSNTLLPDEALPNCLILPYWDDLYDGGGAIHYQTMGTSPNRMFIIEWSNWWTLAGLGPMTFEVLLFETSGDILFQYNSLSTALGSSATVGIEDASGAIGLQYSYNTASLQNSMAILFAHGALPYEFQLAPANQTNYGPAGSNIDHILTVNNTGTEDDTYDISASMLAFDGLTWNKQGMVVNVGTTYDSRYAIAPCVIKDNSTYKMWYSGNDGTNGHVMYASSPDGIAWAKYGMVMNHDMSYDLAGASDPCVLKVGGVYRMWYTAYDGTTYRIAYATSTDGIAWTKHGVVINAGWAGELHTALPMVMLEDGIYKMWYGNYVSGYNTNYATSADGVNWTTLGMVLPYGETYAELGIYSPDVIKMDGRYHMWYSGKSSSGTVRILYADSPDGISWTRHGVAITFGPAYETSSVDRSCTMLDGNTVKIWYSGYVWTTPAYGRIMYATQTHLLQTNDWPVVFRDIADTVNITSITVPSNSSRDFITRVSAPITALPGDSDNATVFATSRATWTTLSAGVESVISAYAPDYAATLSPSYQAGDSMPGGEAMYTLTLTNGGRLADSYGLAYGGNMSSWDIAFYDMNMTRIWGIPTVQPGGSFTFQVGVSVPSWADPTDFDLTTVYADSLNDLSVSATATVETGVSASILLVDDDAGLTTESWFEAALAGIGRTCDVWRTNISGTPPWGAMSAYAAVIWMTGDMNGGTLTPGAAGDTLSVAERAEIAAFLGAGGRLYMSSGGLGWDSLFNGWSAWTGQYLGASASNGNFGSPYQLAGIDGDTIGDGLSMAIHTGDYCTQLSGLWTWNSLVGPSEASLLWSPDMNNALIRKDDGSCRAVYSAFDLADIGGAANRSLLLGRILYWLENGDAPALQVLWVSPPDGAVGVPVGSVIQVCFSAEMDRASAEAAFWASPTLSGAFSWNGTVMTFAPDAPLALGEHYAVGFYYGAHDIDDNQLGNCTWGFSTGDLSPPEHTMECPAIDGWTLDRYPHISVHVTDMSGVNASTIRLYIQGFRVFCDAAPIAGGYNVSYWHETGFATGTLVTCRIVAADMLGNALDFTWHFTVEGISSFAIPVHYGWNLVSLPLIQENASVGAALSSLAGQWDVVKRYDSQDPADPWKTYRVGGTANDLFALDHTMGFWLHALANTTLTVYGVEPGNTTIALHAGWNLVGYPSLSNDTTIAESLFGTGYDRVEGYDAMSPYLVSSLGGTYIMRPGEGYWVRAAAEAEWPVH